jgi:hypothetical protein
MPTLVRKSSAAHARGCKFSSLKIRRSEMQEVMNPPAQLDEAILSGRVTAFAGNGKATKATVDELRDAVSKDDRGKWDIVLPRRDVLMQDGRLTFPECEAYECGRGLEPSHWATGQLCQRLGIPAAYFRRCPATLRDAQFNYWNAGDPFVTEEPDIDDPANGSDPFEVDHAPMRSSADLRFAEPAPYRNGSSNATGNGHQFRNGMYSGSERCEYWLLRARESTLRALLTDRYAPLDNRVLVDALCKALPPSLEIQWLSLDDEAFHLRLIDSSLAREVLPGDPLMAGIHVSNSETGKRSLTIDSVLYRQVCTNGLIRLVKGKSILSQRHVAVSPPHFNALLREALPSALAAAEAFAGLMADAVKQPLNDVQAEINGLKQHWHLSQSFAEQIEVSLQKERSDQQETVFGLVNAVTHAAQSLDAEARYEMEVLAGSLLERKSLNAQRGTRTIQTAEAIFGGEAVRHNGSGRVVSP